jgi:hypothetical protein
VTNPTARIEIIGRGFDLSLPLGSGMPRQTAGGAQYEEQARPRDVGITVYIGDALVKMDVPILLGSVRGEADQTSRVEQLFGLAQGSEGNAPPNFTIRGPFENSGLRCQFEPPEYAEEPPAVKLRDGTLVRQAMVLKLIEYQDPQDITITTKRAHPTFVHGEGISAGATGSIGPGVAVAATVLREGENLLQVSARMFGTPQRAGEIGTLNKIRDTRLGLNRGRRLRLPT